MSLFDRFKHTICSDDESRSSHAEDPIRLATAAVLLDIAYADGTFTPNETEDITSYLTRAFSLTADMARELMTSAEEIRRRAIDHFALTSLIRKNASLEQRIEIVRTMWRVVYSDGKLTDYEHYLVRKLADLLGLEHHVMINTKVEVLRERGQTE